MNGNFHKKNKWIMLSCILVGVLLVSGCAQKAVSPTRAPNQAEKSPGQLEDTSSQSSLTAGNVYAVPESSETQKDFSNNQAANTDRLIIKNATLSLIVKDPPEALDAITQVAEKMKGYVVSANLYQAESQSGKHLPHASITIRVPVEKLNEALSEIKSLSSQLPQSENIESQDITSQYTDLDSRLRNLKDTEEQLRKIMDQAYSTEDVLSVYNQLTQVREQIEVIEGQMKYYRESAALSSISTELIAEEEVEPLSIAGWKPVGVARDAVQALINTMKTIVNIVIWLVILVLPVLAVLYVIFVLPFGALFRYIRNRRKNKKAEKEINGTGQGIVGEESKKSEDKNQ